MVESCHLLPNCKKRLIPKGLQYVNDIDAGLNA